MGQCMQHIPPVASLMPCHPSEWPCAPFILLLCCVPCVVLLCVSLCHLQLLYEGSYCNYSTNRLRGAAALDVLALQSLGLEVLPLPVAEWQVLQGDAAQQQRYLKARLDAATG